MTIHDDVLARLAALGGGPVSASTIAWRGERLPTGAVWASLLDLWEQERVVQSGEDRWRLPEVPGPVQMALGEGA